MKTGCLPSESSRRKTESDRMAAMLSRLGGRGYGVKEAPAVYGSDGIDFDPDFDFDSVPSHSLIKKSLKMPACRLHSFF